ncbi:MAG: indole-3-glycerol phosphate synthase TrpC [Acidimicrobiia bacterium]|nr:indole-3-glycerol phosphate synthase TrpC [Acidimicrobiia bacterium]
MLSEILISADRRAVEAEAHREVSIRRARAAGPAKSLRRALSDAGLAVIAEIKRRSPSAGVIDAAIDPVAQARAYEGGGAAAISVLTEPDFFGGSLADLTAVSESVDVPVLRKDFTRNEAQIWEARAAGADAVLLIVAALDDASLVSLIAASADVGVEAIVEAHTVEEVDRAVAAGAEILGVNNRDLTTFVTDLATAEEAAASIPDHLVSVAESGVSTVEGAARMRAAGYDAILVGEALVRHEDPARFVDELRTAS